MTKPKLKDAVDKYKQDYAANKETTIEVIKVDNSEADAQKIIDELDKLAADGQPSGSGAPSLGNGNPPAAPEKKTSLEDYDEFEANAILEAKTVPFLNTTRSVIVGWELKKKLHPKRVEPHVARDLNAFARAVDHNNINKLLLKKGEYGVGQILKYEDWSKEQGLSDKDENLQLLKL